MYDYVIIGAGSAGCVIANRLSADPSIRVLLLEAGSEPSDPWIKIPAGMARMYLPGKNNWGYMSLPEPGLNNREIYWPRGKVLGGTSAINGMLYVRGHPLDFDDWAQRGNFGWSWDDLLPLFKRGEDYQFGATGEHGAGGELSVTEPVMKLPFSQAFIEAAAKCGHKVNEDFNSGDQDGVGFLHFTIRNGSRNSTYDAFVKPIRHRRNLDIVTDAFAERIVIREGRACGVEYSLGGERRTAEARREIVLSGGVINSPQLLMLSGIGPAAHLKEFGIEPIVDLPGVGQNLHDHLYTNLVFEVEPASSVNSRIRGAAAYLEGLKYVLAKTGNLTSGSSQTSLFARVMPGADRPDIQINSRPLSFEFSKGKIEVGKAPAVTVSVCQLRPHSRGEVRLTSPDPRAAPSMIANYMKEEWDRLTMIGGVRMAEQIVSTEPVASRIVGRRAPAEELVTDDEILAYIRQSAQSVYHPVGTCKMGNDALAVVDHRLRVRGVAGLRVADAAIMPVITSGNTNAPAIVIGEKASDLLNEDRR
ncbi:GMC family oxidoreductase [Mesorhizobium australicum]|uniref:Choline dehydrogenase n=1 Tax=Mesorhizobium australicum TaxID=536018 RepID=A0A1X7PXP9_9HYPH|nr:GMC family oxidoreductase N-terminal domain-containing protein [Mesorhizobium australicum]SMH56464.1 choline dehydrogenase [Mesorhizobium australicum]